MSSKYIQRQFAAAIAVNFVGFSFGWSCAWANVNFLQLQSIHTTLEDGPITYEEATLG